MTEAEFTTAVIELFQTFGWLVHHERPARTTKGWRTPVQGNAGFPDIVAAKDGRVVFAELKVGKNRATPHQQEWIDTLLGTLVPYTGNEPWFEPSSLGEHLTFVWRPTDWHVIERIARS